MTECNQLDIATSRSGSRIDAALLLMLWGMLFGASLMWLPFVKLAFMAIVVLLLLRSSLNGLFILLLLLNGPAYGLGIPNLFSIVIVLTFAAQLASAFRDRVNPFNRPLLASLAFVLYASASLPVCTDLDGGLDVMRKYVESLALLLLASSVIRDEAGGASATRWWAVFAGLSTLLRAAQYAIFPGGELARLVAEGAADDDSVLWIDGVDVRRLLWPGEEPNYTAAALLFPLALSVGWATASKGWRRVSWALCGVSIVASIVGSLSRSGLIAALAIIALSLRRQGLKLVLPLVLPLVGGAIFVLKDSALASRFLGIGDAIQGGATGRFDLWSHALDNWYSAPVFGGGIYSYTHATGMVAHNTYLHLLAELGLVGLALFAVPVGLALARSMAASHLPEAGHLPRSCAIGLTGTLLMMGTLTYVDLKITWLSVAVSYLAGAALLARATPAADADETVEG